MPTYTYRCNSCEYEFDIKQRMADDPLTDCPECDTDSSLRKVMNSVGIVFKGSGFYVTDSRGKSSTAVPSTNGKTSENGSTAKPETPTTSESSSKADAVPAKDVGKGKTEKVAA